MLLMAAKDVATALTDLINSTKNSSGKPATDPAMDTLKVSAKVSSIPALVTCSKLTIATLHFCYKCFQNKQNHWNYII